MIRSVDFISKLEAQQLTLSLDKVMIRIDSGHRHLKGVRKDTGNEVPFHCG
jgi:hypothetical protein